MESMYHQFNDIPQIPYGLAEEQSYGYWISEQSHQLNPYRQRMANNHVEAGVFDQFDDYKVSSNPSLQRFIADYDGSPFNPNLLHAHGHRNAPIQMQYRYAEAPFPPAEPMMYSERNKSPEGTSSSDESSHIPQNELHSPHALQQISYESPGRYLDHGYPSPQVSHDGHYSPELVLPGGGICPKDIENYPEELENATEEQDYVEGQADYEYEPEPIYPQEEVVTDNYKNYAPSISNPVRNAEYVRPMSPPSISPEQDDCESEWEPPAKAKRRRSSASSSSSKSTTKKRRPRKGSSGSNRVQKRPRRNSASNNSAKGANTNTGDAQRPFRCLLAGYGCTSRFSAKNEWKRHISTQHIKLGFWRCDLCPVRVDPNDEQTVYHNDFNRKDLFSQHLRRMHAAPPHASKKEYPVNEDNLAEHQQRCYQIIRNTPHQSACLFCERTFQGAASWDERLEHIGRHFEKDGKACQVDVTTWKEDKRLEQWLLEEGLIAEDNGSWKIGDGRPRRDSAVDSDQESDEDD